MNDAGCWVWTGALDRHGYGRVGFGARKLGTALVHKVVYEAMIGLVPAGRELDHVKARGCSSNACCNPAHLEPVTHRENVVRGDGPTLLQQLNAAVTHCPKGHSYDEANTYRHPRNGSRGCKACRREATRQWRARSGGG
jgi:hypothetical protein